MSFELRDLFEKGGGFMYPLLFLSVVSVTIIVDRLIYYGRRRCRIAGSLGHLERVAKGEGELPEKSLNPLFVFGRSYLQAAEEGGLEHAENVAERDAARLIRRSERGLQILALIGSISPLVGLLGTVWGMVKAFAQIAELGERVTASDFAGGIWTGLLTTVAGLMVAIPTVSMVKIFEGKVDQLAHGLNEAASLLREWVFTDRNGEEL